MHRSQLRFRHFPNCCASLLLILLGILIGCQPNTPTEDSDAADALPTTSTVPLQVLVAADIDDLQLIERRWQADSDQPIELKPISLDELLSTRLPACDVVIFPSRHVLDLIEANAIYKLPATALINPDSDDGQEIHLSESELAQVRVREELYAMPLGVSLPTVIASESFPIQSEQLVTWHQIEQALKLPDGKLKPVQIEQPDLNALVDRFLFIAGGVTTRNSKYGLLFEIQSMTPRLTQPEFLKSLELLKTLGNQPGGAASILGSDSQAWTWATKAKDDVVAIATPLLLNADAAAINSGKIVQVASASEENDTAVEWNTGSGLSVSMSSTCRQSQQAVEFIKWIRSPQTRSAIAAILPGVMPGSPTTSADATSWIAHQQSRPALEKYGLVKEPSLPNSHDYRKALAHQIVQFLAGEKSAEEALEDAKLQWQEISAKSGDDLRKSYERSLGLN